MGLIIDFISDLIFPNRCCFCGSFISWDKLACKKCVGELEVPIYCSRCGRPECECGERTFYYDGCVAALPYTGSARKGILALKYHNGINIARYLAPELAILLKRNGYLCNNAVITAVPMTKKRRSQTGYNHAEYIAKYLSEQLNLRCDFKLIKKNSTDTVHHELSAEERKLAVKGLYCERYNHADITGKTVIICDDIITTGSTLSECASVLKAMGAEKVFCAVLGTSYKKFP